MHPSLSLIGKNIKQRPIPVVCAVVVFASVVFMLLQVSKITVATARLETLEQERDDIRTNVERARGLDTHIEAVKALSTQADSRVIAVEDVARNYELFYELEVLHDVQILNLQQLPPLDNKTRPQHMKRLRNFEIVPVNLSLQGEFANVMAMMAGIKARPIIAWIDEVEISGAEKEGGPEWVSARLAVYLLGRKAE